MCPFCNLEENRTLHTGNLASAILSDPRIVAGHSLVIPKRHVEDPSELTQEELLEIFSIIAKVRSQILKDGTAGCDIRQNYRPFLPEGRTKVNHVHFHVIPRDFEDELYTTSMQFEAGLFKDLSESESKTFMEKFKK
jgi:diadenosine tetraphosphate (Ap4A) HIT family hydrolase